MKLKEIQTEALRLDASDRAALVCSLLDSLPAAEVDVSDEEALRRDAEAENGKVKSLSHQEFVRRVHKARSI